jgi:hypothetical protein
VEKRVSRAILLAAIDAGIISLSGRRRAALGSRMPRLATTPLARASMSPCQKETH